MSDKSLPKGWIHSALGDLVREVHSKDPAQRPDAEFTYFDISSIDNESGLATAPKTVLGASAPSRARQAIRKGDVLFSTVRPGLRAIAQVPEVINPIASTGFCVLRAAVDVAAKYLFFLARSDWFLGQVLPLQRGVSYPAVRDADVLSQIVPVAPAAEQARIVAKLEELLSDLDAGVADLKAAQRKLQQYRQSLLKAAVEGALTAAWREQNPPQESGAELLARILVERRARWEAKQLARFAEQGKPPPKGWQAKYPEPVAPDISALPELPHGWVWASVDQVSPSDLSNGKSVPSSESGARVLRLTAVKNGQIDLAENKCGDWTEEDAKRFAVVEEDLLIVRGNGSLPLVGRAGLVGKVLVQVAYPDTMIRLRVTDTVIRAAWVNLVWNSYFAREHLEKRARTSAGIYKIAQPDILTVPVPVPPLAEQEFILNTFQQQADALGAIEVELDSARKQSTVQRQNILRAAFAGQLVPQDPYDEPASVLLERIRAERQENETAGTRKRMPRKRT